MFRAILPAIIGLLFLTSGRVKAGEIRLLRITLEPANIVLDGAQGRQQLLVTGHYSDGSIRDLTRKAKFRIEPPDRLHMQEGVIYPRQNGSARVIARMDGIETGISVTIRNVARVPPLSFVNDVMPIFSKAGCNAGTCHGNFNGKNGFRLSLRGENPAFDLDSLTRDTQGRRTCAFAPEQSLILLKPTGRLPHEGGVRFLSDSHEYRILKRWIAEGGKADAPGIPHLVRLELWPSKERVLWHGELEQQIVVRATFSDGTVRDVTHLACYEPSAEVVRVSPAGLVQAEKSCEVTVVARYLDQRLPCRLAFVPERPNFRWPSVTANNFIDDHVFSRLKTLQIEPSRLADDSGFLRRAYLDVCGILPTPEEVRAFLADKRPDKRDRLVAGLLQRPEYADFWALKWADLLRNEEKAVDAKGVRHFHAWLKECVSTDMPLDRFARELLLTTGSTYEHPPANFYRTNLQPEKAAETTGQLFMGVRLACARCHNHPFDRWTQEDYYGLSAFFARVRTRMVTNKRKDKLDKHELKGEMIVWLDREGEVKNPHTGQAMPPRLPGGIVPRLGPEENRLPVLAGWLADRKNPFFARVMANRIWYHLMGRGIVEPVDDFRESNPAVNEPLLDALARALAEHGFSQKHLIRLIMASRTYQLSSRPTPTNKEDETNFSHVIPRLLQAEQLLDVLCQATGVPEEFTGHPRGTRAAQLPGVAGTTPFLRDFGRPDRLLACECERGKDVSLRQAFQMISSETMAKKIQLSPRIGRLLEGKASTKEIAVEFYLAALSRFPTARELKIIDARLKNAVNRRSAVEDLLWAVLNTKEFLLRQ